MAETTTIILAIVGTGVTISGVLVAVGRVLTAAIVREFNATNKRIDDLKTDMSGRIDDLKTDLSARIDETNSRVDEVKTDLGSRINDVKTDLGSRINDVKTDLSGRIDETNRHLGALRTETQQGFEQVHRELGEHRERMAKLEGALDGFLAGRRDRDAA